MITTRECPSCRAILSIDEFRRLRGGGNRRASKCVPCEVQDEERKIIRRRQRQRAEQQARAARYRMTAGKD